MSLCQRWQTCARMRYGASTVVSFALMSCSAVFFVDEGEPDGSAYEAGPGAGGRATQGDTRTNAQDETRDGAVGAAVEAATPGLPRLPDGFVRGPLLALVGGSIAEGSNDIGLAAFSYIAEGPEGTVRAVDCVAGSACSGSPEGRLCMRGRTQAVPLRDDGTYDYNGYWGAEIALDSPTPWSPDRVVGFSFRVYGQQVPAVRFQVHPYEGASSDSVPPFCLLEQVPQGPGPFNVDVLFSQLTRSCWEPGDAMSDDVLFDSLGWLVPASQDGGIDFDFCVSELRPILRQP